MQILRGLGKQPPFSRPTAVAIGNFDGLHLGHQRILHSLAQIAARKKLLSLVLTFSPHPEKVLSQGRIAMIQTLAQRLEGLRGFGVQAVLVAPFNRTFSSLTSQEFVQKILVSLLRAEEVIVGENFRFGQNRRGDVCILRLLSARFGIRVHSLPSVVKDGQTVSSSLIRSLLTAGDVDRASVLLGYPYEIIGRVVRGASRGKTLGFPTANLRTANEIVPRGVFITAATFNSKTYPSLTYIGQRPTFGRDEVHIETYIFDFEGGIYRKTIRLRFFKKVREEKKFKTPRALVKQIQKDSNTARDFFQEERTGQAIDFFPRIRHVHDRN